LKNHGDCLDNSSLKEKADKQQREAEQVKKENEKLAKLEAKK
jgi:hypothetical protein